MTGQQWLDTYPEKPGAERDEHVMQAVRDGTLVFDFTMIRSEYRGRVAKIGVTTDAAHVVLADGSRFRPMCSARLLQRICDEGGFVMPTELIVCLAYDQAPTKLEPCFMPSSPQMVTRNYSIDYNLLVEKQRNGATGLLANVGKYWVLSSRMNERPHAAANLGWFGNGSAIRGVKLVETHHGYRAIQPLSTCHDCAHEDESQLIQVVAGEMTVDGVLKNTLDVMTDPALCGLVSYEERFPTRQN